MPSPKLILGSTGNCHASYIVTFAVAELFPTLKDQVLFGTEPKYPLFATGRINFWYYAGTWASWCTAHYHESSLSFSASAAPYSHYPANVLKRQTNGDSYHDFHDFQPAWRTAHMKNQRTLLLPLKFYPSHLHPPTPSLEEPSVELIGTLSAISSSKQHPVAAALDELIYRGGTEDV